jgi:malic enzyme
MGISEGKITLYTAAAGVDPNQVRAVLFRCIQMPPASHSNSISSCQVVQGCAATLCLQESDVLAIR